MAAHWIDPSHQEGGSVNDGVRVVYITLHVSGCGKNLACGTRAVMAKFDVESAYRIVQVHPMDRWLLGISILPCRSAYVRHLRYLMPSWWTRMVSSHRGDRVDPLFG